MEHTKPSIVPRGVLAAFQIDSANLRDAASKLHREITSTPTQTRGVGEPGFR